MFEEVCFRHFLLQFDTIGSKQRVASRSGLYAYAGNVGSFSDGGPRPYYHDLGREAAGTVKRGVLPYVSHDIAAPNSATAPCDWSSFLNAFLCILFVGVCVRYLFVFVIMYIDYLTLSARHV